MEQDQEVCEQDALQEEEAHDHFQSKNNKFCVNIYKN